MALAAATMALGCGGRITIPELEPGPTPTIPPLYVTFEDALSLFSISYPREWDLQHPVNTERIADIVKERKSESQAKAEGGFFFVGQPQHEAAYYTTILSIRVMLFPIDRFYPALEPYYAPDRLIPFNNYENYLKNQLNWLEKVEIMRLYEVKKIVVGRHEGFLIDFQDKNDTRTIKLEIPEEKLLWILNCSVSLNTPGLAKNLQECEAVLRSFRILQ